MRLALLPGVVDLVPFVWLLSTKTRVKHAAAIAGVIGVARVALPQLMLAFIAARYGGQGPFGPSAGTYRDPSCFIDPFMLVPLVLLILGIIAVSALFCVFLIRRAGRSQKPSAPGSSQLQSVAVILAVVVLFASAMLAVYLRSGEEDPGEEGPPQPMSIQQSRCPLEGFATPKVLNGGIWLLQARPHFPDLPAH